MQNRFFNSVGGHFRNLLLIFGLLAGSSQAVSQQSTPVKDSKVVPSIRPVGGKQTGIDFRFMSPPKVRESVDQSAMRRQNPVERFQSNLDRVGQTIWVQQSALAKVKSDLDSANTLLAKQVLQGKVNELTEMEGATEELAKKRDRLVHDVRNLEQELKALFRRRNQLNRQNKAPNSSQANGFRKPAQSTVGAPSNFQEAAKTQAENEAVLDEMFSLRNSIGGGLSGSLSDLAAGGQESREALQAEMDDAFREELARLMQQADENVDQARDSKPPTQVVPARNNQVLGLEVPNRLPPVQVIDRVVRTGKAGWNQSQVETVRQVARKLEQLAWELEDIGAYQNADRLRREAEEMRLKARRDTVPRAMLR